MSSTKSKKKSKSTKLPEPIKIKREDDHLMYPMEHYVDDRVELIRQIFSSLKPKTITNLAPEFLKKSKLEDIQEQCLNEILGISKKRLLSIINSTKCPTDTDTSSEDEVNAVAEHISLEEISSDSDIADSKAAKTTGKKKQKTVKQEPDKSPEKQFSVLELLELQARARAIRSQLALEPVTKIEVDTDSEEDGPPKQKPPAPAAVSRKKVKKTPNGKSDAPKRTSEPPTLTVIIPNGEPVPTKRVKLKRNFRKQNQDDEANSDDKPSEVAATKIPENVAFKKEDRSASPDVIPIVAVPETLCISDSDEENKETKVAEKDDKSEKKGDETPIIAAQKPQQVEILSVVNIQEASSKDQEITVQSTDETLTANVSPKKVNPPESEEEGEILEDEEEEASPTNKEKNVVPEKSPKPADDSPEKENDKIKTKTDDEVEEIKPSPESNDQKQPKVEIFDSGDDDNDDVISLEGEDLVNEMKEHMKDMKEVEEIPPKPQDDIICLDDSSEDEAAAKKKAESWNDRWLNSRKVSKVLAASRLGNKVRKKIKESKKAKKLEEAAALEKEQEKPQQVVFVSKHELGSVEQYKELLESMPKKSTD